MEFKGKTERILWASKSSLNLGDLVEQTKTRKNSILAEKKVFRLNRQFKLKAQQNCLIFESYSLIR